MKLEGSLDAFSLPDIFQLLSFTKKTGGLHLAEGGLDGAVHFTGGSITGASGDSSRQSLARRLIAVGGVTDEALSAAVARASDGNGVGVCRALLEGGAVTEDLVRGVVTDHTVDAVLDLLRWEAGDFAFVVQEQNPDEVGVTLLVEDVLAQAQERRDSWDDAVGNVPSHRAVPRLPVTLESPPEVSVEEWALLALVDGRRAVSDLVDLFGRGEHATVALLSGLVARGLLLVAGPDQTDDPDDHVAAVLRRQQLLAPLEGEPFTPVVPPVTDDRRDDRTDGATDGGSRAGSTPAPPQEAEAGSQPEDGRVPASASATATDSPATRTLGGAHVPGDVVPPRPEPFLPRRQADFDDGSPGSAARPVHATTTAPGSTSSGGVGDVVGATATAADPESESVIERDPNVNRSLMLRLIAGVRGL